MSFLQNLKIWLRPPRMQDPDFGNLVFIHISNAPERSYWECRWTFPKTGSEVEICLRGDESGPSLEARQFYLRLPGQYEQILAACRPRLEQAFTRCRRIPLPDDMFSVLKLVGFGVEDPKEEPVRWEVAFETTDDDWLCITIPFVGETAMEAVVDT